MIEGTGKHMKVLASRCLRRYGEIETVVPHIAGACAGITRKLMNRNECCARFVLQDGLGAVAVMNVKVVNHNPLGSCGQSFQNSYGHVAQITEAHGPTPGRVVTGWTHQAKHRLARARGFQRSQPCTYRSTGILRDLWEKRSIQVKVSRLFQSRQV